MARMIVIYGMPKSSAACDRHSCEVHVPPARQLPGLRNYETSRGPVISLYGAMEACRVATLHFDSLSDINPSLTSEFARGCAAGRQDLVPRANEVQMFLFDTHSS
jgi:uncharacterized protein (TIGR02118 family)